jgi:hypothetical protein
MLSRYTPMIPQYSAALLLHTKSLAVLVVNGVSLSDRGLANAALIK